MKRLINQKTKALLVALTLCVTTAFAQTKTKGAQSNAALPTKKGFDPGNKPGDLGSVIFTYQNKAVTYTTVRAKDGNIWLQQNLGSLAVAGDVRDDKGFGDLFQWGRWDDGHQVRNIPYTSADWMKPNNPTGLKKEGKAPFYYDDAYPWWGNGTIKDNWSASNPNEVTETNGCDPCKVLGTDWHVPSMDEFSAVLKAEEITDENSAYVSNLKFTLGGYRKSDNNYLWHAGKAGVYWTSNGFKDGIAAAYDVASGQINGYNRGDAKSIRCIKSNTK